MQSPSPVPQHRIRVSTDAPHADLNAHLFWARHYRRRIITSTPQIGKARFGGVWWRAQLTMLNKRLAGLARIQLSSPRQFTRIHLLAFRLFFVALAFFTFGLSFSGLGDVLRPPFSAASNRAWASFSLYSSLFLLIGFLMSRNRGKKAREKRDIATRELSIEERGALLDALLQPPLAISYAIIGALTVEHELDMSIKSRLRRISPAEWEAILSDKDGPLGTFDRKIKFASYLGILDTHGRKNLDIIRNIRNRFAHTKRLINFDHSYIADELAKMSAPKGQKRIFAKTADRPPQAQYITLCLHSIMLMSKKRYGNQTAAYKAWLKRKNQRSRRNFGTLAGIFGALAPEFSGSTPPEIPISSLPLPPPKTDSDPNKPVPLGLLSGLLPFLEEANKDKK